MSLRLKSACAVIIFWAMIYACDFPAHPKGGTMILKTIAVGPLESNCYVIGDENTKKGMIVDPGDEPDRIMEAVKKLGLDVEYIVITHAHFDHVGAIPEVKEATGAKIALHKEDMTLYEAATDQAAFWGYQMDSLPKPDMFLGEGDEIKIGSLSFKILHTPGHSPGGICLFGEGMVVTGDTLFAGSVGRTDFHGGSERRLKESFKRLLDLPENTRVLAGHGPDSTIGTERRDNPFVDM